MRYYPLLLDEPRPTESLVVLRHIVPNLEGLDLHVQRTSRRSSEAWWSTSNGDVLGWAMVGIT